MLQLRITIVVYFDQLSKSWLKYTTYKALIVKMLKPPNLKFSGLHILVLLCNCQTYDDNIFCVFWPD